MWAFVIGGLVFAATCVVSLLMLFAASMSDSPSAAQAVPVTSTFVVGSVIAGLIIASHWLPSLGW